jgi:hypothetical protein
VIARELNDDCKRCKGTGVAITVAKRGPTTYTAICSCPAGRSIPQPPRVIMPEERARG